MKTLFSGLKYVFVIFVFPWLVVVGLGFIVNRVLWHGWLFP